MSLKIPVEVYSRVSGYFRPVNQWNRGKQEEFSLRRKLHFEEVDNEVHRLDKGLEDTCIRLDGLADSHRRIDNSLLVRV